MEKGEIEEWASLEDLGFPDYAVSNFGEIRNLKRGRYIRISSTQDGMAKVGLMKPNDRYQYTLGLAQLVAIAFIPTQERFDTPINLDGDRMNCSVSNLAWRPRWFAVKYYQQFFSDLPGFEEPILEINSDETFESTWDAATKYGLLERDIMLGIMNEHPIFPTNQEFRRVRNIDSELSTESRENRGL